MDWTVPAPSTLRTKAGLVMDLDTTFDPIFPFLCADSKTLAHAAEHVLVEVGLPVATAGTPSSFS